ncbi:MAG: hypothetical protein EOO42_18805 [Flavobacteriales bacterium]|nr:MAG: hypothetical protein EOO42_18805 [Flavobacteriales bacterium]
MKRVEQIFSFVSVHKYSLIFVGCILLAYLLGKKPFERYDMITIGIKTKGIITNSYRSPYGFWFHYQFTDKFGQLQVGAQKSLNPDGLSLDYTKEPIQANITYLAQSPEVSCIDFEGMETKENYWANYWKNFLFTFAFFFFSITLPIKFSE